MKNIDWIRLSLLLGMGVFVILLIQAWDEYSLENQQPPAVSQTAEQAATTGVSGTEIPGSTSIPSTNSLPSEIPAVTDVPASAQPTTNASTSTPARLITLSNDVLDLKIDLSGGDIVDSSLLQFDVSLDDQTPFRILTSSAHHLYIAQSGLIGPNGTDTEEGRPNFSSSASEYRLEEGTDSVTADLTYQQGDVLITKRFTLTRGEYLVDVSYLVENNSTDPWSAGFYTQIKRDSYKPPTGAGLGIQPYLGAAVTTPDDLYKKISFGDLDDQNYSENVESGWVTMIQHYFISAWLPDPDLELTYNLRGKGNGDYYYIGFTQPLITVPAGQTNSIDAQFYVGPKDQYRLAEISEGLDKTVDYSWLWWAAEPLFWLLQFIQGFVVNWGIAIILLTLCVKALFFKLSATSYRSMGKMKKLQPKMAEMKERLGNDRQALSQEMMKLYKKEKVNPMGGCLPILIQMPVFIALYWVLLESVELRHAPFFFWIQDLSAKDPWYILPIIMGASMYFQMKLNPTPPDPTQAKIMQIMPIMFTFMFLWFPAGLVLYWTVNNILSMAQQWYITRKLMAE